MSRVAIRDLYMDIADNCCDYSDEEFDILTDTEIVPRKIVEDIIEVCEMKMKFYGPLRVVCSEDKGAYTVAKSIKEYAESLLKQFEEDKDE